MSSNRRLVAALSVLLPIIVCTQCYGDGPTSKHVFRIRPAKAAPLTGFRLQGVPGIVTALHGVVGHDGDIAAQGEDNYENLSIGMVNLKCDLALLISEKLRLDFDAAARNKEVTGLTHLKLDANDWNTMSGKDVKVTGYPMGIYARNITTRLSVRETAFVRLGDLVDGRSGRFLKDRGSPDHEMDVVSLQGFLLPGHSGGPIMDVQNRVLAVAMGGLPVIGSGHGFAVALSMNQGWDTPLEVKKELDMLSKLRSRALFADEPTQVELDGFKAELDHAIDLVDPDAKKVRTEAADEKSELYIVSVEPESAHVRIFQNGQLLYRPVRTEGRFHLFRILPGDGLTLEAWVPRQMGQGYLPHVQRINPIIGNRSRLVVKLELKNVAQNVNLIVADQAEEKRLREKFEFPKGPETIIDQIRNVTPSNSRRP